MYDDQPDSFDQAIAAAGDCTKQLSYAKMLKTASGGSSMVPGWSIAQGGKFTETITINQGFKRQWWIVLVNCDEKTSTPSPVSVTSIAIADSGKVSVPCSTMGQYDVSGYNWAIALMTVAILVACVLAFLYWKKSTIGPTGVSSTAGIGYNEL